MLKNQTVFDCTHSIVQNAQCCTGMADRHNLLVRLVLPVFQCGVTGPVFTERCMQVLCHCRCPYVRQHTRMAHEQAKENFMLYLQLGVQLQTL